VCLPPPALQIRAEKAPSLDVEELQAQTISVIQHLHHDGEHPGSPTAQVRPHRTHPVRRTQLLGTTHPVRLPHSPGFATKLSLCCTDFRSTGWWCQSHCAWCAAHALRESLLLPCVCAAALCLCGAHCRRCPTPLRPPPSRRT
jgi:hypothetical protein